MKILKKLGIFLLVLCVLGGCVNVFSEKSSGENKHSADEKTESVEAATRTIDVTESPTPEEQESTEIATQEAEESTEIVTQEVQETLNPTEEPVSADRNLTVHFLDVGEGNAALLESAGHFMLVDGGDRDYSSKVVATLKNYGVETLDYVVVSHFDADHLNGIVGALHAFAVDMVLAPDYTDDTNIYQSYVSVMQEKGLGAVSPQVGDTYALGSASFSVVGPVRYDHGNVNDNSIVIKITNGENTILFTGDAQAESEGEMLGTGQDLRADVLEIGHHGSSTSTTESFLAAVNPSAAVLSCGAGNSYGHPTQEVITHLQSRDISLYRTDEQGEITVTSDGVNLSWSVESSKTWAYGSAAETTGDASKENWDDSIEYEAVGNTETAATYILNTHTRKFHLPGCPSAKKISVKNYAESNESRDQLISEGYDPCGNCHP